MSTYFTSDPHLGHVKVSELRGFESTTVHDLAWLNGWKKIKDDDIVHVLGDISGGSRSGWLYALDLISELPGRKRLISGNHDPSHSMHRDAWRHQQEALEVFESVQDFARVRLHVHEQRRDALLSHFPYPNAEGADRGDKVRYPQYRLRDLKTTLIHGHTHIWDQHVHFTRGGTPMVHVGWDAHRELVTQREIEQRLGEVTPLPKPMKERAQPRGTDHHSSKLSEERVRFIKQDLRDGRKISDIADEFEVDRKTIYNIKHGVTWAHINIEEN